MSSRVYWVVLLSLLACTANYKYPANINPELDGLIYDGETAVKIAEAIWLPIYGDEIYKHRPFIPELKDSVWVVSGTVRTKLGGAPYIVIRKKDGRILDVSHEL